MVVNHRNPPRWKCVKKFCMLKEVSWSKASFNTSRLDTRWAPTAFHHPHLRHHVQLLDLAGSTRWRHWWRWMRCLELSRIAAQLCRRFRGLSSQDFRHCSPHRQSENFCGLWIPHEPAALRLCEGVGAGPECTWSKQLHWSQHLFAGLMACEIPTCMKQRESLQLQSTGKRKQQDSEDVATHEMSARRLGIMIPCLWDLFVSWISFEPSEKLCLAGPDCLDGSLSSALSPLDCKYFKRLCCFGLEFAAKPTVSPYVRDSFLLVFKIAKISEDCLHVRQ